MTRLAKFTPFRWLGITFIVTASATAGLIGFATPVAAENTLVIAAITEPEGIDGDILQPASQNVVVQMYEGITTYQRTKDANGNTILDSRNVTGHLAESWTTSDGGKLVTFKLRRGVKSPFGNEMTADDWVWSWNKSFKQKRTGNFIARVSNVVPNGVEKVDDYTVSFRLDGPSAILLKAITLYSPSIYDTKVTKEHATSDDPFAENWIRTNSAGYGPYHLAELRPGEQAIFTANPNYFAGKPYFDRVVYRAVPSGASRLTLLRSGNVHLVEKMTAQQLNELENDPNVRVLWLPGRGVASVRMNVGIPPFTDVRVRKAFNHAVNKQAIIDTVFFGHGQAANTIVPSFIDGAITGPIPYPYDVARAKTLLAEAGYPNGLEVELSYSNFMPWEEAMAINIQSQLKAAGITVKLARITAKELLGRTHRSVMDLPFFTGENGPIVLDTIYTMFLFARSTGPSNRVRYSNPKVDALIDEARVTTNREKALALMAEAQEIFVGEAPWIFTNFRALGEAMSPNLKGYVWWPDDHERWVDLYFEG